MITGVSMANMAFKTTEEFDHDRVPTFLASRLTVSSNLDASFVIPHVKYTSSSPDMGAVNFLRVAPPDVLASVLLCCRVRFFLVVTPKALLFKS